MQSRALNPLPFLHIGICPKKKPHITINTTNLPISSFIPLTKLKAPFLDHKSSMLMNLTPSPTSTFSHPYWHL
ncbi:hypothetical protein HanIR_Chr07g0326231 [Helianthus annuus]|nr:hypothetical protein HanIR_Chr07g0326231 [Helianthus annuus]